MKVLAAIANYGDGNRKYVERLIQEYRAMEFDTHVVILSDRHKDFGDDVEVRVGLPAKDPWSLPFAHRPLFAERIDSYDLFIYSEDDTLITQNHVRAFVDATAVVPHPRIVGFMRYEESPAGKRYCSTVHAHFRWKPETVERFDHLIVAEFTNAHSAAFILTRKQLQYAIDSGGFLVAPHSERYDLLCTAATDPYTQCGMRKVIPISHFHDFLLHHLPNKYIGRMGVPLNELDAQLAVLRRNRSTAGVQLFPTEKKIVNARYNKNYHEKPDSDLSALMPKSGRVLSIGCGAGAIEASIKEQGLDVIALPLDDIIAEVAKTRGVGIISGQGCEIDEYDFTQLSSDRPFDVVLLTNVLQHLREPQRLLKQLLELLANDGAIVGVVPNFSRIKRRSESREISRLGYPRTLLHATTRSQLERWFREAGLHGQCFPRIAARHRRLGTAARGALDQLLADDLIFTCTASSKRESPSRRLQPAILTSAPTPDGE